MKSRTAAALLSGLGVVTGGVVWALPGLADAAPTASVVDSTVPDDDAPDVSSADDTADDTTDSTPADDAGGEVPATESGTDRSERARRIEAALQALVDDGTLTAEQVAAVVDALGGARIGEAGRHLRLALIDIDVLTEMLDLSTDELREALMDGETVAALAEAQGVALDDLVDALVAAATERIDGAVADGRLTADEAAALTDGLTEAITERLESAHLIVGPRFADGDRGRGRRREGDGPFGSGGPWIESGQPPLEPHGQGVPGGGFPGGEFPGGGPLSGEGLIPSAPGSAAPSGVDATDATSA